MTVFQITGTGSEPEFNRKLRQGNNVQYCRQMHWQKYILSDETWVDRYRRKQTHVRTDVCRRIDLQTCVREYIRRSETDTRHAYWEGAHTHIHTDTSRKIDIQERLDLADRYTSGFIRTCTDGRPYLYANYFYLYVFVYVNRSVNIYAPREFVCLLNVSSLMYDLTHARL